MSASKNKRKQGKLFRPNVSTDSTEDDDWKDASDQFSNAITESKPTSSDANKDLNDSYDTNCDNLVLHRAIFEDDISTFKKILKDKVLSDNLICKKDKHGNTPLHLACMLGRSIDVIEALLKRGASIECKNLNRWTPFHEACSYGNREIIKLMTLHLGNLFHDSINQDKLAKQLSKTRDYRVILKWEFKSWVPFLTRVLPNDVCSIHKHGGNIRIDTHLIELGSEVMSWSKADGCLIYSDKLSKKWVILNNKNKKYKFISFGGGMSKHVEYKVDDFMSTDIIDIELESSDIVLSRSTSGWIWKEDKAEKIGKYESALYDFNNVFLVTRKRREHLSEQDLKRNKLNNKNAMDMLKFGRRPQLNDSDLEDEAETESDDKDDTGESDDKVPHRESLPPPPRTKVTWSEYYQSEPGKYPTLGREIKVKITKTPFKAGLAMSDKFPLTKGEFLDLLSIVPLKMFKKLKEFIEMRLPDGFPVRVDVPVLPFLTARITFEDFEFLEGPIDRSLFEIPEGYEEDTETMLPMLERRTKDSARNN